MWQINYPFPYKEESTAKSFRGLTDSLLTAYKTGKNADRAKTLSDYRSKRNSFFESLKAADGRYASFQLWQEGVARYTQYKMARLAARKLKPSRAFAKLPDFVPFGKEADRLLAATLKEMLDLDLKEWERVVFYPFGAVECLMLDHLDPNWRSRYFSDKFALEKFYPATAAN